jgi:hypothetical protein
MLIKLIGLGLKPYVKDYMNLFDAVIVIISTVDIILNAVMPDNGTSSSGSSLSVLRGLRIVRLLKIIKSWK